MRRGFWTGHYVNGVWFDDNTMKDPLTGVEMCKDCWDGLHRKVGGCPNIGCHCECWNGRNKGLNHVHKPKIGCKEQTNFLDDVDGIRV